MDEAVVVEGGAEGEVPLIAQGAIAEAFAFIAGRQHEAKARGEGGEGFLVEVHLIPIVQKDVTDAGFGVPWYEARDGGFSDVAIRNGVTELVRLAEDGPFLGKREVEAAEGGVGEAIDAVGGIEDVLNDAGFLVVGFFDQEGVVHDAVDRAGV